MLHDLTFLELFGILSVILVLLYIFTRVISYAFFKSKNDLIKKELLILLKTLKQKE